MAFQQGLSGLGVSSKALDVTSHNIANASTVGYKGANAHFGDVYAAALNGGGASQIGIGVNLAAVQQQFNQGNITTTNNPLDISINGAGFFRMDKSGATTYTRNGQFHLDKSGFIVNDQGMKLTGYIAQGGVITAATPAPLQIDSSAIPPVATGSNPTSSFKGVKANLSLDSRATTTGMLPWGTPAPVAGQPWTPDPKSYNWSTALTTFDSLGNPHNLTMYFRKAATAGDWEIYANVDGTDAALSPLSSNALNFDTSGKLTTTMPLNISIDLNGINAALGKPVNAAVAPLTFDIDLTGTGQYGQAFGTNRLEQDGYAPGNLVGLSVGADGVVQGRYSNGKSFAQGQVVLTNFTNPNGLLSMGNNQWVETSDSGPPLVGAPQTSSLGTLTAASVEESNVDLTAELVNLITFQRNYQANAQSIKTQDQIMQTIVNLR
ncbi:flagellar hook protein FlgE [Dechloromonas sp. ZY10]|uniref:flagellar hook protein FlgE n=1 Tax=Dechloromonas aquae TaxID=2664436 RepID=UPI00352819D9